MNEPLYFGFKKDRSNPSLKLEEDGFNFKNKLINSYDNIDEIFFVITAYYLNGMPMGDTVKIEILLKDRKNIKISEEWESVAKPIVNIPISHLFSTKKRREEKRKWQNKYALCRQNFNNVLNHITVRIYQRQLYELFEKIESEIPYEFCSMKGQGKQLTIKRMIRGNIPITYKNIKGYNISSGDVYLEYMDNDGEDMIVELGNTSMVPNIHLLQIIGQNPQIKNFLLKNA
jgi:hypothetical protein